MSSISRTGKVPRRCWHSRIGHLSLWHGTPSSREGLLGTKARLRAPEFFSAAAVPCRPTRSNLRGVACSGRTIGELKKAGLRQIGFGCSGVFPCLHGRDFLSRELPRWIDSEGRRVALTEQSALTLHMLLSESEQVCFNLGSNGGFRHRETPVEHNARSRPSGD